MLLSAVYVLVVAKSSSEVPEGLMNNPVLIFQSITMKKHIHANSIVNQLDILKSSFDEK